MNTYHFTEEQLRALLEATIDMYEEYQKAYGHEETQAKYSAEREVMEGLDAELELTERGECKVTRQTVMVTP